MRKMSALFLLFFIIVIATTKLTGQDDRGWKVWVKTSPCSGRHDWVSVAKENPAYGGGGGVWSHADLILTGTASCVRSGDDSCTFAAADAVATTVRASDKFSKYCCREYSVWRNVETKKMSVVLGKFGSAGFPWEPLKWDLCCEEAEALAEIPGACSGSGGPGGPGTACGRTLGSEIQKKWFELGGKSGFLGCPISNESDAPAVPGGTTGRWAQFGGKDGGYIILHGSGTLAGRSFEVHGCIFKVYSSLGGTKSWLRFPVSDEYDTPGGRRSDFEGGYILWDAQTRACGAHRN